MCHFGLVDFAETLRDSVTLIQLGKDCSHVRGGARVLFGDHGGRRWRRRWRGTTGDVQSRHWRWRGRRCAASARTSAAFYLLKSLQRINPVLIVPRQAFRVVIAEVDGKRLENLVVRLDVVIMGTIPASASASVVQLSCDSGLRTYFSLYSFSTLLP